MTIDFAAKKTFDSRLINAPAAQIFSVLSDASLSRVVGAATFFLPGRTKQRLSRLVSRWSR